MKFLILPKFETKPIPVGAKSGSWTCISPAFKDPERYGKALRIRVRCVCGNEQDLHKHAFKYEGKNRQCYSCGRKASSDKHRNGAGKVSGKYMSSLRNGAKRRSIHFDITAEQIWSLFLQQGMRCALSGLDLIMDYDNRESQNTASLDRIDPNKGYTLDNVQWVHKLINSMKLDMDQNEFLDLCQRIVEHSSATFMGG